MDKQGKNPYFIGIGIKNKENLLVISLSQRDI